MKRLLAAALLLVGAGGSPVAVPGALAQSGDTAQVASAAEQELTPAQRRTLERRRERRREWERRRARVPTLRPEELVPLLGDPQVAVIDVTCEEGRGRLTGRIPGSTWEVWNRVADWAPRYPPEKTLVVYCA